MLKGALIGFGKIAITGHMPAYQLREVAEKAEIIAAVEPNEAAVKEQRSNFPDIKFYKSIDDLLGGEAIDFVDICTPPKFHSGAIEKAAANKASILCEKPLAFYVSEAKTIYKILHREKPAFAICHQYKYSPVWKEFKKFIDESSPERKLFIQFNVFRTNADTGYFAANPGWRTDKNISGGGILSDTGVHYLYLSNWLMGNPVSVFTKNTNITTNIANVEDTSITIIEYERGTAQINLTWGADARENYAAAVSQEGSLTYTKDKLRKRSKSGVEDIPVPDASDKSSYIKMYGELFLDFFNKIEGSGSNSNSLTEAFETAALLDACYRSDICKKIITL